jgi:hypothetical protein
MHGSLVAFTSRLLSIGLLSTALGGCAEAPPPERAPSKLIAVGHGVQMSTARVWHAAELRFRGPRASQRDISPNPFLDFRLALRLRGPHGRTYRVPGFFDGDGAGGSVGDVWVARFTPDAPGRWTWRASFRAGPGVAVSLRPTAGRAVAFDGARGVLEVAPRDPSDPGFLSSGRLEYVGSHYLKFRDGAHWIKGGTDSPENLLGYYGFEGAVPGKYGIHRYAKHVRDFRRGDPDWGHGRGRGIIGALNYLASQRVNLVYFLPMNIGGDGQDTWPFAGPIDAGGDPSNDNLHYDLGRMRQWETVFAHAQRLGIVLHFVLSEAEENNKRELDDGELGTERKLYYRELVARFGHHNALIWNLCEEYNLDFNLGPERVKAFANYLAAVDPYDHPITVHHGRRLPDAWAPFLGDPRLSLTSLQHHAGGSRPGSMSYEDLIETFRARSAAAGRPIGVSIDEFDRLGKRDDETRAEAWPYTSGFSRVRKSVLWPVYLSGGQLEFILEDRLQTEDFRPYEGMWRYTFYARRFLEENLPFSEMEPADELLVDVAPELGNGQVFRKRGEIYAVYLPEATGSGGLDLRETAGIFTKRWYDPRVGAFKGPAGEINAGARVALGPPPEQPQEDWVVLLQRKR